MAPETAREVAEFLKRSAAKIGEKFTEPDDDWVHMGFVVSMDKQGAFFVIDPSLLIPERKEQAIAELGVLILRRKPRVIGFVLNTRQVTLPYAVDGLNREEVLREAMRLRQAMPRNLADEPRATESLVVNVNTRSDSVCWTADIVRTDKNVRTLGEWKEFPDRESRFDDLTKTVFRVMDALRDLPSHLVDDAIDRIIAKGNLKTYEIEREHGAKH